MSAFTEDIRLAACAIIKDNTTNVDRNIVIFEYNLPPLLVPMCSAFYQSSGTSLTTDNILTGTYFPFYGSKVSPFDESQNTLIKATQHTPSGSLSPELQRWQLAMPTVFKMKSNNIIFQRFTHFHELKISALIGSNWWSSGGISSIIRGFVLSHVWDGEKFIEVDVTPEINIDQCFKSEHVSMLEDDNVEINTFLRENSVDVIHSRHHDRSRRTHSTHTSRRSRSRSRSNESDNNRESSASDDQQPKSTMVRTYAVGPHHTRPTSKGGANTRRKRKKCIKNKSKRGKCEPTRRRRRYRSH